LAVARPLLIACPCEQEITLSSETDGFYRDNMYNNFGDISINIKDLVDHYQSKTKTTQQITSIADMRNFIDNYPQFRQMSGMQTDRLL
jgi:vacuolar protein sorting-associated protein 45